MEKSCIYYLRIDSQGYKYILRFYVGKSERAKHCISIIIAYVSYKNRKELAIDLELIYKANIA